MRILHTSDWHVGRMVRGRSREEEHRAVLGEIADIVRDEKIDLVLLAGDVFDHQSPTPAAEDVVYEALLKFTSAGAQVVMIAGNHDSPERLDAVRPLLKFANVHAGSKLRRPEDGGCIEVGTRDGETARIALLPWPSRARIVTADDLMHREQAVNQSVYWERCARVLKTLSSGFSASCVNLILAHLVITGAVIGGGERTSETVEDYWMPPDTLNLNAQYVALGHIHKRQSIGTVWPAWYCGSPLQLDFGEEKDVKGVNLIDVKPGLPVREPRFVELKSGKRMLTVKGSLARLTELAASESYDDAYLRVHVTEPSRFGLADEVRALLPNAVEVRIEGPDAVPEVGIPSRQGLQPRELLSAYFEQQVRGRDDGALKLFDDLLEEEHASPSA